MDLPAQIIPETCTKVQDPPEYDMLLYDAKERRHVEGQRRLGKVKVRDDATSQELQQEALLDFSTWWTLHRIGKEGSKEAKLMLQKVMNLVDLTTEVEVNIVLSICSQFASYLLAIC